MRKPSITIVGAGSLATSLVPALSKAGYTISEIVSRKSPRSQRRASVLAQSVGARAVTGRTANFDAALLWLCVPDGQIHAVAESLARRSLGRIKFCFHSSGALTSSECAPLHRQGVTFASVHPLMTFVAKGNPLLAGVPFAVEGEPAATRLARRIVRDLGGESFLLPASRKAAYHAWATMTSPLLLAFFVTLEESARAAGLKPRDSRRKSLPIIRQTLENYARLGPGNSFSGPIIRGDLETIAKHIEVLRKQPDLLAVYVALARIASRKLPARHRTRLRELLKTSPAKPRSK